MQVRNNQQADPDDFFSDTRMSFGDHLEDLRVHLWRAIGGFLIALVAGFAIGKPAMRFIAAPVEKELKVYWDKYYQKKYVENLRHSQEGTLDVGQAMPTVIMLDLRELKKHLTGKEAAKPPLDIVGSPVVQAILSAMQVEDWLDAKEVPGGQYVAINAKIGNPALMYSYMKTLEHTIKPPTLATMNVQEAFMVYMKVSMVVGFVLASPWIFFQVWAFVAAGLYPQEKRYVNVFLPVSLGLFLAGVLLCEFVVIPRAVNALLWFNEWLDLEPDLRLNEWLTFALLMPLIFGLSFQTPLVMFFLERIGVMTVEIYRAKRRIAWFVLAVFSAVITPTTDAFTMLFLWLPMSLLYELGILMCHYAPKRPTFDMDVPESEELIEV